MRILFIRVIGRKKFGGGERWVVNAAAALRDRGHKVFVAGGKGGVLLNEAEAKRLDTLPFTSNLFNLPVKAFALSRFLRREKIDLLVCMGRELTLAGLAARWGGKPAIIRRASSPPSKNVWKIKLRARWFVDGVVTNTDTIRKAYDRIGLGNDDFIKVIYNGIQLDDEVAAYDFSKEFPGRTIALCVGRAVADKGYFHLLDALPSIHKACPELLFYLIGDGKDLEKLRQYAKEKGVEHSIHFAGYILQPVSYYKACDLFVHPSLYEGMPNAPMEAMAYGKPVVMTRVDGADELSNRGQHALLIPPADPEAIARAVISALQQPTRMKAMGEAARTFVRMQFNKEARMAELEQFLIQRLVNKRKNGR
ncbi:MAG: glycosyltransferase [Bacteroidales bacterium]|jgi:glycosyltransferase involved in cell wall biosynthesis|nr:glycosyltransferase [Bacteroidales bacterium]